MMSNNMLDDPAEETVIRSLDPNDSDKSAKADASFERVLEELGTSGQFQVTQYILLCLSIAFTTALTFSYVFIGHTPDFTCNKVNETELLATFHLQNDSTAFVTYRSCDMVVSTNISGKPEKVSDLSCPSGRNFSSSKGFSVVTEWDMVCELAGVPELVAGLYTAGTLVGGLPASILSDRFGRRTVFVVCSVGLFVSELAIIFAPNLLVITALRFMSGLFHEGHSATNIVLGREMWTPSGRTTSGLVDCFLWVGTTLLVGGLAYVTQDYGWRAFQIGAVLLGILFPIPIIFLKESPRWLTTRGRTKEALDILRVASKQNKKDFGKVRDRYLEYAAKEKAVKGNEEDRRRKFSAAKKECANLFCHRKIILVTAIASFSWLTHDLTYYGMFMMSSTLAGDRFLNYSLMSIMEIPSALVLVYMMPRMGRRAILAIFLSLASASLLICSFVTSFGAGSAENEIASLVFFMIGKLTITSSYNVMYIYTPEMFPTNIRTTCFAICYAVSRIGSFLSPYIRPFHALVPWGPAVMFCAMSVGTLLLTPWLPEMKDVNLKDTVRDNDFVETKRKAEKRS